MRSTATPRRTPSTSSGQNSWYADRPRPPRRPFPSPPEDPTALGASSVGAEPRGRSGRGREPCGDAGEAGPHLVRARRRGRFHDLFLVALLVVLVVDLYLEVFVAIVAIVAVLVELLVLGVLPVVLLVLL